jgi:hypothetical protein
MKLREIKFILRTFFAFGILNPAYSAPTQLVDESPSVS